MPITALQKVRMLQGKRQIDVAKEIGVQQGTVSQWEVGNKTPRARMFKAVAKAYGCTVDELLNYVSDTKVV